MSDKEEAITDETQEQGEQQTELAVEDFGDVVETQRSEVVGDVESIKESAVEDVRSIEGDGSSEEIEKMTEVAEKTTEEAEKAEEEYYEELRSSIPNFNDKVEAIKKEAEASEEIQEEYNEKLKDIPNARDLAESFATEESVEEPVEEVKIEESPVVTEPKTEKTDENLENEKTCPKCGALFPGTANFCGECGTELGEIETAVESQIKKEENLAMKAWLENQKNKGKDTVATRFMEEKLAQKDSGSEESDERIVKKVWLKGQEEKGKGDATAANFIREELKQSESIEDKEAIEITETKKVLNSLMKTAEEIHFSNSDKSKDYEALSEDLDKIHKLISYLSREINSNIPEKSKTREFLVGIANKIMKERSLKHEEYLKNRKDGVKTKKVEGNIDITEDMDFNRDESKFENNESEIRAIDKGIMVKVTADIPSKEHWKTEVLKNSTIRVKAGSKLTITGVIKGSKIIVEKGGALETSNGLVNMKSEIIYEK